MAKVENIEGKANNVRGSFLDNLYDAEVGEVRKSGKHKGKIPHRWSGNWLIPKSNKKLIAETEAKIEEAIKLEWPKDTPKIKAGQRFLRDGDEEEWAGYAGHMYISASRTSYQAKDAAPPKRPFRIIGRRKVKNDDGDMVFPDTAHGEVYAGSFNNLLFRIWCQDDDEYGKRVNASIEGVQFWEDGEAFGGGGKRVDYNSAFDEYEGDDDDGFGDNTPEDDDDDPFA